MPDAILIDPKNPSGTFAAQPFRWSLDGARSNQIVRFSVFVNVFIKRRDRHTFMNDNILTVRSDAGFVVG